MAKLKQYKVGQTYYGYDPLSGQGFAADTPETLKKFFPTGIDPTAGDLPVDPTPFNSAPGQLTFHPEVAARLAGAAGLSVDDYQKLLSGQTAVSPEERSQIYGDLGIPGLEKSTFTLPKSTEQLYTDAYATAGLGDIKSKFVALNDEINNRKATKTARQGDINENPWLSEASRLGRTRNLDELADSEINNLIDQQKALKDLYESGLTEINNLVTRTSTDETNTQKLNADHLTYLHQLADQKVADLASSKNSKLARYLPEFLSSAAASKKPDTIGSAETGFFKWNPVSKTFEQVVAGSNGSDGLDGLLKTEKQRTAFNQIVNNYNKSPLIAASDRTTVLKNTVNSIKKDPGNAATQMNLAYGYIQALDTYQSAVREGEITNVNSIDSKIGQLQNWAQQITSGQTVRPEVALQIAGAAEDLVKYISNGAAQKEKVFESQARVNGIENAWNNFRSGFTTNYDSGPAPTVTGVNGNAVFFSDGTTAQFPDQKSLQGFLKELDGLKDKGPVSSAPSSNQKTLASVSSKNLQVGIINGYDINSYATDPKHEKAVRSIYQSIPAMTTSAPVLVDRYIQSTAKGSPVRGKDVLDAAEKYDVDPNLVLALMQQDSTFGTKGKAVRTKNPGNVGNTDSGGTQGFASWRDGVFAVARNLSKRRVAKAA